MSQLFAVTTVSFSVLFILAMLSAVVNSGVIWKMVADVNRQLEGPQQFSYFWWYFGKFGRLWETHRRFYPRSPWRLCFILSFLLTLLCFYLAAKGLTSR